jgi:hypothetical protein
VWCVYEVDGSAFRCCHPDFCCHDALHRYLDDTRHLTSGGHSYMRSMQ